MQNVTLEEAQGHLAEIIDKLSAGEEVVITRDDRPVATIRAAVPSEAPRFGTLKGSILYIAPDFDAIPDGFEDYVP
jgi:antitoxin (DNA-binding transcriptional repressor) of toxin-antitoxin stability system